MVGAELLRTTHCAVSLVALPRAREETKRQTRLVAGERKAGGIPRQKLQAESYGVGAE